MVDTLIDIKNLEQVATAISANPQLGLDLLRRMIDAKKNEVSQFEDQFADDEGVLFDEF